jgi:hypothetical protein
MESLNLLFLPLDSIYTQGYQHRFSNIEQKFQSLQFFVAQQLISIIIEYSNFHLDFLILYFSNMDDGQTSQ